MVLQYNHFYESSARKIVEADKFITSAGRADRPAVIP